MIGGASGADGSAGRIEAVRQVLRADALEASAALERLVGMASRALGARAVAVALLDEEREVFHASRGLEALGEEPQLPLDSSLCDIVVGRGEPLVWADVRDDPDVRDRPGIGLLGIVAYAGVPLRAGGMTIGTFCAAEWSRREWSDLDVLWLHDLAALAGTEIECLLAELARRDAQARLQRIVDALDTAVYESFPTGDGAAARFLNASAERVLGGP